MMALDMVLLILLFAMLIFGIVVLGLLLFASLGREMKEENRRWKRNLYETNRD